MNTPLRRALAEDGRRQTWLAERIGVDSRQVWTWVHGLHEPAAETKRAIADALGRDVGELWPGHSGTSDHSPGHPDPSSEIAA